METYVGQLLVYYLLIYHNSALSNQLSRLIQVCAANSKIHLNKEGLIKGADRASPRRQHM